MFYIIVLEEGMKFTFDCLLENSSKVFDELQPIKGRSLNGIYIFSISR